MKIATSLTLFRIAFGPFFLVLYLYYDKWGIALTTLPYLLISLLVISELTDFLDGYIARKWNQVTDLGKVLDPMADSIARLSVLFAFTQGFIRLPLLLVFVFFYRDAIISTLRTICALNGVTLAARMSGKIKALVQATATFIILILMIPYSLGSLTLKQLQCTSYYIIIVAAIYTFASGIEYIYANRLYIKKIWSEK